MGGFIVLTDPSEMERRFSNEDLPSDDEDTDEDGPRESLDGFSLAGLDVEAIRVHLHRIPPMEQDVVELFYFRHKTQTDIAAIFEVSQPAINYRLRRAVQRLRFLLELPDLNVERMTQDLRRLGLEDDDIRVLVEMYLMTCQTAVAKKLRMTQGAVRNRFLQALEKVAAVGAPPYISYALVFDRLRLNFNILHEINPQHPFATRNRAALP